MSALVWTDRGWQRHTAVVAFDGPTPSAVSPFAGVSVVIDLHGHARHVWTLYLDYVIVAVGFALTATEAKAAAAQAFQTFMDRVADLTPDDLVGVRVFAGGGNILPDDDARLKNAGAPPETDSFVLLDVNGVPVPPYGRELARKMLDLGVVSSCGATSVAQIWAHLKAQAA